MLEKDRYQQSPKLYTFGMIVLMLFWVFTLISLYIIPYLVWNFHYQVPEMVIAWQLYWQESYELSIQLSKWITFLSFAIPSLICLIISWLISSHIDTKIIKQSEEIERTSVPLSESPDHVKVVSEEVKQEFGFASTIILFMLLALVVLFVIEWLISVPAPAS